VPGQHEEARFELDVDEVEKLDFKSHSIPSLVGTAILGLPLSPSPCGTSVDALAAGIRARGRSH
ncbi:MAG: hypothetical protein M3Q92_13155, partial [Actinomycetota bacterium]|nr:hypothetical protein [Actinomycetota bacterium]